MLETIYVDVWCRQNPWPFEIQWVDQKWNKVFYYEFQQWSNNIGEYLAIYFWLHHSKNVYTDSRTALAWCRKQCNTKVPVDDKTQSYIYATNTYFKKNTGAIKRVHFWDTKKKWQIPADFGRKG
jgi:hypothetical protein